MKKKRIYVTSNSQLDAMIADIQQSKHLAFDTETTGLRPYHGDKIFGLSVATAANTYYLSFKSYDPGNQPFWLLRSAEIGNLLKEIFSDGKRVFIHNAKFDMAMVRQAWPDLAFKAIVHCTQAIARIEYNDHQQYSLDACAARIGFKKDEAVSDWLEENKAFTWETIPGKLQRRKNWHFDKVPFGLISEYAMIDAEICLELGHHQIGVIDELSKQALAKELPMLAHVTVNEQMLTKTVFEMEQEGVLIDRKYVETAVAYSAVVLSNLEHGFSKAAQKKYMASPKLFAEIFQEEKHLWTYTDKNNPSFDSDTLKKFKNPLAGIVLKLRDEKSRLDFLQGFLYHADAKDRIHPNFNPPGTATGRLSSNDPNFQNLTGEDDGEYPIRRAIVPPPGYFILSIDYKAMEYVMMLELAAKVSGYEGALLKEVRAGKDVHQAVADLASGFGLKITRAQAKMTNFLTIYGGGEQKLADGLGISLADARKIRSAIFKACPEIELLMSAVTKSATDRKYIFNWMGRRSYFPNRRFAYKALNYLIQGGCADVTKKAMNDIHRFLEAAPVVSKMVMTIHDELVFYIHKEENFLVPILEKKMQDAFKGQHIQMQVSSEASYKSLHDLVPYADLKEEAA